LVAFLDVVVGTAPAQSIDCARTRRARAECTRSEGVGLFERNCKIMKSPKLTLLGTIAALGVAASAQAQDPIVYDGSALGNVYVPFAPTVTTYGNYFIDARGGTTLNVTEIVLTMYRPQAAVAEGFEIGLAEMTFDDSNPAAVEFGLGTQTSLGVFNFAAGDAAGVYDLTATIDQDILLETVSQQAVGLGGYWVWCKSTATGATATMGWIQGLAPTVGFCFNWFGLFNYNGSGIFDWGYGFGATANNRVAVITRGQITDPYVPPFNPCDPASITTVSTGSSVVTTVADAPRFDSDCGFNGINRVNYAKFTPSASGNYRVDLCSTLNPADSVIGVMTTCGDAASLVACVDDGCVGSTGTGGTGLSSMTFDAVAGTDYYIALGMFLANEQPPAEWNLSINATTNPCTTVANAAVGSNSVTFNATRPNLQLDGVALNIYSANYLRLTVASAGVYTISNCSNFEDTALAILTACGDGTSWEFAAAGNCDPTTDGGSSTITAYLAAGTYFIAIGGPNTAVAYGQLNVDIAVQPCTANYNACAAATTVNVGFNNNIPINCGAADLDLAGRWFPAFGDPVIGRANYMKFSNGGPVETFYTVTTCGYLNVDARMAVLGQCNSPASFITADDDGCADEFFAPKVTFRYVPGNTYYIAIGGFVDGEFQELMPTNVDVEIIEDTEPFDPCAPANVGVMQLGENPVAVNDLAPALVTQGSPCTFEFGAQAIAKAMYFRFTPSATGEHIFSNCSDTGATVDSRIAIATQCGNPGTILGCDDDGCTGAPPWTSKLTVNLTAGTQYFFIVGGYDDASTGPYNFLIEGPGAGGCIPDLNADLLVNGQDLGILLGQWGPCASANCPADLNQDGSVNGQDLGVLLGAWGACPQ
jgi:hypothetical protein